MLGPGKEFVLGSGSGIELSLGLVEWFRLWLRVRVRMGYGLASGFMVRSRGRVGVIVSSQG